MWAARRWHCEPNHRLVALFLLAGKNDDNNNYYAIFQP
jgi:hypothetical protein